MGRSSVGRRVQEHPAWSTEEEHGNPVICLSVWQAKACEALEALDELLESEVPVITSHLSEVLTFCLEVSLGWAGPLLLLLLDFSYLPLIHIILWAGG